LERIDNTLGVKAEVNRTLWNGDWSSPAGTWTWEAAKWKSTDYSNFVVDMEVEVDNEDERVQNGN